ncbi:MAG TPA: VOC family protein, partial [Rhodopila sp.]|nr:VOC family protein [Rhodopila sp.]
MALPTLDHVVVDVRESLDAAASAYIGLGFQLTPRGHHTLGSSNNLAMFGTNYLELLGFGQNGGMRPELMACPAGLNGLVFKTDDAAATAERARQAGLAASPAAAFSRPV